MQSIHESPSRREFLRSVCVGSASIGLVSVGNPPPHADDAEGLPAGNQLIVRSAKPFNAEPALNRLVSEYITPLESFYIRNHGAIPQLETGGFQMAIEGMVDKPLQMSIAELIDRFPASKLTATLTCAGNRRNEFTGQKIAGVQWGAGAIGNANWSGISLSAVLRQAGIQAGAKHVWFEGADVIMDKSETYPFGGSIPLEKAVATGEDRPGVILATRMNDKPLAVEHGAPVRAVVPGYIGARSVKWLKRIVISDRPSPNHYVAQAYKLIAEETPAALAAAAPLNEFALNSVICIPSLDAAVSGDRLKVQGFALPSGGADRTVKRIELSTDGETWSDAKTVSPVKDFCWVLWSAEVTITDASRRILVRATDSSGQTQPREMIWNVKGYQYNAWHQVTLKRE